MAPSIMLREQGHDPGIVRTGKKTPKITLHAVLSQAATLLRSTSLSSAGVKCEKLIWFQYANVAAAPHLHHILLRNKQKETL